MNTNKNLLFLLFLLLFSRCNTSNEEMFNVAYLDTDFGEITFVLANETPIHRDNFIKQANDGIYDGVLFHRVIQNFVIQAGDPASVGIDHVEPIPSNDENAPIIKAEIDSQLHHIRGAVGMARMGDHVNPDRNSSATQFYIVMGGNKAGLDPDLIESASNGVKEIEDSYKTDGGAPHLDEGYTVFGFVIDGMDVADRISYQPTGGTHNRPIKNIIINEVKIKKIKKSKIEELDIFKTFYSDKYITKK